MKQPSILCLVLDCLRPDAITPTDAPNIHALADDNLSFAECVTPANWSLPAHASLFSGEWPHDHRYYDRDQQLDNLPLIETLNDEGYETVGASANVFVSSSNGFDRGFDRFYETRRPLNPRGLNPFGHVRKIREDETSRPRDYLRTFADAATHDRPIASLDNFARAVALSLDRRYGLRRYLPFVDDEGYGFLTRASNRTSDLLVDEIERTADRSAPLFAFANYMDTHYPYEPPERHFSAVTEDSESLGQFRKMEPNISHSRTFRNTVFGGTVDEDDIDLVRAAYRAEVRSVDEQVRRLVQALEEHGIMEETIVVITSDHGECLGEVDLRGERTMGHFDAMSEHLWTVPLIIANPNIDERTVGNRVSLKSLFDLLTGDLTAVLDAGGRQWVEYFDEDPVLFELPAQPSQESSLRSYEHFPDWFVERVAKTHTVLGFDGKWTAAVDSNGESLEFHDGDPTDESSIPMSLRVACEDAVAAFPPVSGTTESDLPNTVQQQLRDLGYV